MLLRINFTPDIDGKFLKPNVKKYYEEHFKGDPDIIYKSSTGDLYYVLEVEQVPLEGQIINTKFGICFVTDCIMNFDKGDKHELFQINHVDVVDIEIAHRNEWIEDKYKYFNFKK